VWTRHYQDADGKPLADIQDTIMLQVQRRRRPRAVR